MICLHGDSADYSGCWRSYLAWIGRVGLRMGALDDAQREVAHVYFPRLAV